MVSFIIVNYNGRRYIERCLRAVFDQPLEKEVIVVDNGSTDGSRELSEKYNAKIIYLRENMGYPYAVNRGIEASRGEYVFLLTPTTFLEENIEPLLQSIKNADAVAPLLTDIDGKIVKSIRRIPSSLDFLFNFTGLAFLFKNSSFFNRWKFPDFDYSREEIVPQPMSCCLLIKRDVVEKVGGFDEDFFLYFSDVDFFKRFNEKNYKCIFSPGVRAIHIRGGIAGGNGTKRVELFHRDLKVYLKKHHSFWHFLAFLNIVVYSIRILLLRIRTWIKRD